MDQNNDVASLVGSRPQTPNNAFAHEHRVCIHMLAINPSVNRSDHAMIFNEIFKDYESARKFPRPGLQLGSRSDWQKVWSPPQTVKDREMRIGMQARIAVLERAYHGDGRILQSEQFSPPPPQRPEVSDRQLRKRTAAALYTPPATTDDDDDDDFVNKHRSKSKRQNHDQERKDSYLPTSAELLVRKPQKDRWKGNSSTVRPCTARRTALPYLRPGNVPIMLSADIHRNAPPPGAPYIVVNEADAHPTPPALVWRVWDESSQGINSVNGFESGKYAHARVPPPKPPLCKDLDLHEFLEHINPNKRLERPVMSPYISTSSRLLWITRRLIQMENPDARMSVLDSSVIGQNAMYYVPPFHKEFKRHFAFDRGAHYYKGISEHLVWNEISEAAMIHTYTRKELFKFLERNPDVERILRLDRVRLPGKFDAVVRSLKAGCIKITDEVAAAIAKLAMFYGIGHTASQDILSRVVYEIAQGWGLMPEGITQSHWQSKARCFTHTMCRTSESPVSFADQIKVYNA